MSVSGRWDKSAFSVVRSRVPAGESPAETPSTEELKLAVASLNPGLFHD